MQGTRSGKGIGILTLLAVAFLAGCGGNQAPATTPTAPASVEGQLAFYGRKVVQTASLALDTVDQVTQARLSNVQVQLAVGTITKDQVPAAEAKIKAEARQAIATLAQIGPLAKQLVVTLQIIEVAGTDVDRTKGIEAARQILKNMQQLTVQGSVPIGDETSRQVLGALMGNLADLLMNVALLLPPAPVVPAK